MTDGGKVRLVRTRRDKVRILGAASSGVNEKVVVGVGRQIREAYGEKGKEVRLKGVRFIPSTKVDLDDGAFQVMAKTVVEVSSGVDAGRAEAVDSVVTIGRGKDEGQVLESVKIPYFEQRAIASG